MASKARKKQIVQSSGPSRIAESRKKYGQMTRGITLTSNVNNPKQPRQTASSPLKKTGACNKRVETPVGQSQSSAQPAASARPSKPRLKGPKSPTKPCMYLCCERFAIACNSDLLYLAQANTKRRTQPLRAMSSRPCQTSPETSTASTSPRMPRSQLAHQLSAGSRQDSYERQGSEDSQASSLSTETSMRNPRRHYPHHPPSPLHRQTREGHFDKEHTDDPSDVTHERISRRTSIFELQLPGSRSKSSSPTPPRRPSQSVHSNTSSNGRFLLDKTLSGRQKSISQGSEEYESPAELMGHDRSRSPVSSCTHSDVAPGEPVAMDEFGYEVIDFSSAITRAALSVKLQVPKQSVANDPLQRIDIFRAALKPFEISPKHVQMTGALLGKGSFGKVVEARLRQKDGKLEFDSGD